MAQAENAIETWMDFIDRGGTLMMRRRMSPRANRISCQEI